MPLNLSTKPTNTYNSNNNSANTTPTILNSRSNSIIWSPASMCEQEKSLDNIPTELQQSIENLENRNNFIKHYNNLKNLTLLQQSAARNEFNYGKIDKGYFTHLQQKVKEQIISESNNNNKSNNISKRGENRANNDNINNNNRNSMNNKNTTAMFMLNNNNVIMGSGNDKEMMTRPDSTAHNHKHSEDGTGRRKERNFQVSPLFYTHITNRSSSYNAIISF